MQEYKTFPRVSTDKVDYNILQDRHRNNIGTINTKDDVNKIYSRNFMWHVLVQVFCVVLRLVPTL